MGGSHVQGHRDFEAYVVLLQLSDGGRKHGKDLCAKQPAQDLGKEAAPGNIQKARLRTKTLVQWNRKHLGRKGRGWALEMTLFPAGCMSLDKSSNLSGLSVPSVNSRTWTRGSIVLLAHPLLSCDQILSTRC